MTGFQKFIKYAAIAFGIYLSITIVLVLLGIARGFVGASKNEYRDLIKDREEYQTEDITRTYENIKNLEIDVDVTEVIIRNGDMFKIEGPGKMEIKQEGDKLKISDEKIASSFYDEDSTLTIYIPDGQKMNNIDLEMNYISADIESLNATNLKLDTYNNYCKINELFVDNLEMNNEYGEIDIYNSEVGKLKLDSESGKENVSIKILKNAEIDLEYSDTNIKLIGTQDNYQINCKNQFGNTYIEEKEITSATKTLGNGDVKIELETKYTETNIDFEEKANESNL